jgi:hypothetical protein
LWLFKSPFQKRLARQKFNSQIDYHDKIMYRDFQRWPGVHPAVARLFAVIFLTSCATDSPPPLTADNPANPSAPEATLRPPKNYLTPDELTIKSRQILAKSAKEQKQWDEQQSQSSPND